ncbi:MAG: hypothetical protein KJN84_05220 [Bacteroidia bacterium]|nr:hypothetical protein [Bacteroidia bacterium]
MSEHQLFEKYLTEKMTNSEKTEFENRLQTDPTFKSDFEDHVKLQQVFDILLEDDVKGVIKSINASKESNSKVISLDTKSRKSFYKRWMSYAASFLILVFVTVVFNQPKENSVVIKEYNKTVDGTDRSKGSDEKAVSADQLTMLFKNADKENMIEALAIIDQRKADAKTQLQKDELEINEAIAYLMIDEKKAKSMLKNIASNEQHEFNRKAKSVLRELSFFPRLFDKFK